MLRLDIAEREDLPSNAHAVDGNFQTQLRETPHSFQLLGKGVTWD